MKKELRNLVNYQMRQCDICSEQYSEMEQMVYLSPNYREIDDVELIKDGLYRTELCRKCADEIEEDVRPITTAYTNAEAPHRTLIFIELLRDYAIKVKKIEHALRGKKI